MDIENNADVYSQLNDLYESDKQAFNKFVCNNNVINNSINFNSIKRLVLTELTLNKSITSQRICGFTRKQIITMSKYPERYGKSILRLMDYIYQSSGYMKRLIDYFSNMAKVNYFIDTEALDSKFLKVSETTLKNNYFRFAKQASKFNLGNEIHEIIKRMYLNDVCYAFVIETDLDISYFFLDPRYCQISKKVNGNVYAYSINRSLMTDAYYQSLPVELAELIDSSYGTSLNNLVDVPYENGFCLKYNDNFLHLYPPLFPMIADILLVDEYKELAKTKAVNDAYKLLVLKIPTKDGVFTMGDEVIAPFVSTALNVVQENIGVLPYPGEVESVEFSSSNSDDRDKVSDAVTQMYANMGVSEALMSGASSGSELKLSITNDSGDIFRIYRMLENWISLQMKLRGFIYGSYQFVYKILDITIFNETEFIDEQLKLAQASIPNKTRLCAACGISPSALIGNTIVESTIFKDIFDLWQPLKSSYTSTSEGEAGAPEKDDGELSPSGEQTRNNEGNDSGNRIDGVI